MPHETSQADQILMNQGRVQADPTRLDQGDQLALTVHHDGQPADGHALLQVIRVEGRLDGQIPLRGRVIG